MRRFTAHPGARELRDDVATLAPPPGEILVLTHDMLVEGIHYLPDDSPGDIAWKLVAVNLSDLAAKGARPLSVLLGYTLGEEAWDIAFAEGLGAALARFEAPLLGGDTVAGTGSRMLGLTAIGVARIVPDRRGAKEGDGLWVSGTIGDAGLGLALARGTRMGSGVHAEALIAAYRRPTPRLDIGARLAALAHATADVSDGLLIDAGRIAAASGLAVAIDLDRVPMSAAARAVGGDDLAARLAAATAGDDYQLLAAAPEAAAETLIALGLTRVGAFSGGSGLTLHASGMLVPLPNRLGWEHGAGGT